MKTENNCLVCYPLSLKLFGYLSLIPKTPNRASSLYAIFLCVRPEGREGGGRAWWWCTARTIGGGPLPKTLTLFMTKICDFPHPILDLKK